MGIELRIRWVVRRLGRREEDSRIVLAFSLNMLWIEGVKGISVLPYHSHHDHLVCDRCGDIIEFHDEAIDRVQIDIADRYGFRLLHHSMILTGICSPCQRMKKNRSPSNVIVKID